MPDCRTFSHVFLKKYSRYIVTFALCILFVIQSYNFMRCYSLRGQYIDDEYLTLQYAHYYTMPFNIIYFNEMKEWKYNEWISIDIFKNTYEIDDSTSLLHFPPSEIIKKLVIKRTYFGFVNIIGSLCGNSDLYRYAIIVFNILTTVVTELLLFLLISHLSKDRIIAMIAVSFWGFSGGVISLTYYVRFYSWIMLMLTLALCLHYSMWQDRTSHLKRIVYEIIAWFCIFIAMSNSELVLPFAGLLFVFYLIGLIIRKKWIETIYYGIPVSVIGVVYLYKYTNFLDALFNPENYVYTLGAGILNDAVTSIYNPSFESFCNGITDIIELMRSYIYGGRIVMYACTIIMVIAVIYSAIYVLKNKCSISENGGYMLVLGGVYCGYNLFAIMSGLTRELRYYSPAFILYIVIFAYLIKNLEMQLYSKQIIIVFIAIITTYGSVKTALREDYQWKYPHSRELYKILEDYSDCDVVLIENTQGMWRAYVDDCIDAVPYGRRILITRDDDDCLVELSDCTDRIIVWTTCEENSDAPEQARARIGKMTTRGYSVDLLGGNACSNVYLLKRKNL